MRSPRRTIYLLDERLEAWRSVIAHDPQLKAASDSQEIWNHELRLSDDYAVRYSFALGEILEARGRLLDMLEYIEKCWPHRKGWCEKHRRKSSIDKILGDLGFLLLSAPELQNELLLGDLQQPDSGWENHDPERTLYEYSDTEDGIPELSILFDYRDAKARALAINELGGSSIAEEQIDEIATRAWQPDFSSHERGELAWLAKEYIFSERLFSWQQDEVSSWGSDRYRFIFDIAELRAPVLDEVVRRNLMQAIQALELEPHDFDEISQILTRVGLFIQVFGYHRFIQEVTQDGGQWGPFSSVGSREMIGFVPEATKRLCNRIVIGMARGRNRRSKKSLRSILRGIGDVLGRCVDVTKIVILITDVWDLDSMDEITSWRHQGTKFLVLFVNGRRLVPMEIH
jgi:hypothetical protein